jgi:F-type H+-transporting ATPase subunit b
MENFPHLPTLLSVGAAVIVLTWVLNRFLFKPLRAIIDERQRRSDEGRGKLEEAQATQAQRLDEIEARLREARREAHEIREQALRAGRGRRDELMGQARQQAHGLIEEARAEIAADLETARHDLEAEAERLSEMITERVLGRPVGKAGEGDR